MTQAQFIGRIQKKVDKFNEGLLAAIKKMDGESQFYYPANECTVVGGTDEIEPIDFFKVDTIIGDDGTIEWEATLIQADDVMYVLGDESGWTDFSELTDTIKYHNRRIKRTLRLWEMDSEAIDAEMEAELNGEEIND